MAATGVLIFSNISQFEYISNWIYLNLNLSQSNPISIDPIQNVKAQLCFTGAPSVVGQCATRNALKAEATKLSAQLWKLPRKRCLLSSKQTHIHHSGVLKWLVLECWKVGVKYLGFLPETIITYQSAKCTRSIRLCQWLMLQCLGIRSLILRLWRLKCSIS